MAFLTIVGMWYYSPVRTAKIKKKQEEIQQQLIVEEQLSEVQLQALKCQVNSHFFQYHWVDSVLYIDERNKIGNELFG